MKMTALGVALLLLCLPAQAFLHSLHRPLHLACAIPVIPVIPTYTTRPISSRDSTHMQLGMSQDSSRRSSSPASTPTPTPTPTPTLLGFLTDCQKLGYVRFVVVGGGAILEAVGK
jgi:hypothetical protein